MLAVCEVGGLPGPESVSVSRLGAAPQPLIVQAFLRGLLSRSGPQRGPWMHACAGMCSVCPPRAVRLAVSCCVPVGRCTLPLPWCPTCLASLCSPCGSPSAPWGWRQPSWSGPCPLAFFTLGWTQWGDVDKPYASPGMELWWCTDPLAWASVRGSCWRILLFVTLGVLSDETSFAPVAPLQSLGE